MTEIYLDQNWQQIQPQRSVNETNFTSGSILFNFNVSGLNRVSMKDSYFVVKSSLTRGDGTFHAVSDKVTYAHNWTSALFTNVSVRVSGQEVSACNQYNHLAHTVKMRQSIEANLLSNNYRDMMDYDIDFTRRLQKHCKASGTLVVAGTSQTAEREDGMTELSNLSGVVIRNGDTTRYTIYQPLNLGVFDLGHGAVCGDISIMLNPNPQYLTSCVESAYFANDAARDFTPAVPGANNAAGQYKFEINSIVFMACYAKATKPLDNVKTFVIHEYSVMNKLYAPQLEFQVLPSTEQITVFVQDQAAGTSTIIPATSFKTRQYTHAEVNGWAVKFGKQYTPDENAQIQVTLGAITKPPIMLDPYANIPDESGQVLRWLMTHQYMEEDKRYYERFNDWCSSPYFTFDVKRDSSDTSGFVTVRSNYDLTSTIGAATGTAVGARVWPGTNNIPLLFCVSKYSKVVRIEYSSGYVTSIQMQNV